MTAFLKIDECQNCHRSLPWEWVTAVLLNGKPLAGTGVWRSQLIGRRCPPCHADLERAREKEKRVRECRGELVELLGGEKPYREFNHLAYERSNNFKPACDNLYLWGPCGVGKTHLAYAIARGCFQETLSITILWSSQLSRKVRMKDPDQEQGALDRLIEADILVLDDVGSGADTAYSRQVLQEILDCRHFRDRAGLVVTSKYSIEQFATKITADTIQYRLARMFSVIEGRGTDGRFGIRKDADESA